MHASFPSDFVHFEGLDSDDACDGSADSSRARFLADLAPRLRTPPSTSGAALAAAEAAVSLSAAAADAVEEAARAFAEAACAWPSAAGAPGETPAAAGAEGGEPGGTPASAAAFLP